MSALALDPWAWLAAAGLLAALEIVVPGYLLLGFGLSAAAMAGVLALGGAALAGAPRLTLWLALAWAALALAIWWGLTRAFGPRRPARQAGARDVNDFDNSL